MKPERERPIINNHNVLQHGKLIFCIVHNLDNEMWIKNTNDKNEKKFISFN